MSYQVLARKWRPRNFEQLVGQHHVQQALVHALTQQRLHHAYLFTGTRGVGKTTIARILAKALQCEKGISATPCGECGTCVAIDAGRFVDVIEVDAASRTKVEDTRELLDNVQYAPTQGRFKIYLIDEVHMLSGHSFNALLKTLEEPPLHVKFLLATTDPQKLPVTVLSRCLQFHLKNLLPEQIREQLAFVLTAESIPFEASALPPIADSAQGSLRDALSVLDQAIAYSNGNLTQASVRELLGYIEPEMIAPLFTALVHQDGKALLAAIDGLAYSGVDFAQALTEFTHRLHQIAIVQAVPDLNAPELMLAQEFATHITPADVQLFYDIVLRGQREFTYAPTPRVAFTMTMLRLLAFMPVDSGGKNGGTTSSAKASAPAPVTASTASHVSVRAPAPVIASAGALPMTGEETTASTSGKALAMTADDWAALLPALKLTGMTQALANHSQLDSIQDDTIHLSLESSHAPLLTDASKNRLIAALTQHYQRPIQVKLTIATSQVDTPAKAAQEKTEQRKTAAIHSLDNDPHIQALKETFAAQLIPDSVTPIDSEQER